MTNVGAHPIDPATPVGKVRLLTGDSAGTPIPPEGGGEATTAEYRHWSDVDLQAFLDLGNGNVHLAAAQAYTQLAATLVLSTPGTTRTFRTEDLGLGGVGPGGDIRLIAREWRYIAEQTAAAAADEFVEIVPGPSIFGR